MEVEHVKFLEKESELQAQIDEIEKLMNEGDLKKLKEQTEGIEHELKRLLKNVMPITILMLPTKELSLTTQQLTH